MQFPYVDLHTHRPAPGVVTPLAAGIHPWEAETGLPEGFAAAAAAAQVVGEIGLDFARAVDRTAQERLFREQLALAEESGKPVVLHCVRAFEPTMTLLAAYALRGVVFHGFIGSPEQAARAAARGYRLSFGMRSMRSPRTVRAMRSLAPDRLFLETDDDPAPIGEVYARAAALLGWDEAELRERIYRNYRNLFDR